MRYNKILRETDARWFQIAFLTLMLVFGVLMRDFPIGPAAIAVGIGVAWLTQAAAIYLKKLPVSSLMSATISGLGLCLLCRTNSLLLLALASFLAIASKFVLTFRGKHFFNPTNFGVIFLWLVTSSIWVSPAQWGEEVVLFFWIAIMGVAVVHSAWRFDISFAFLGTFALLLTARVLYLGQPWAVLWHQFNSGALILFTFFMISDPRSTPNHRWGRIVFAVAVAFLTYFIRFHLFRSEAPLLALFFLSPITVALDLFWKDIRFEWSINEKQRTVSSLVPSH